MNTKSTVIIQIQSDGKPVVTCPGCGRRITHDLLKKAHPNRPVRIVCTCKHTFNAAQERRRHYRKRVQLSGRYFRGAADEKGQEVLIVDVSNGGVCFRPVSRHNLQVGDTLRIEFSLDDPHMSRVSRRIEIRSIKDLSIGAEFCDAQIDKALGFYLLP